MAPGVVGNAIQDPYGSSNWSSREAERVNNSMFTYWFSRPNCTPNSPPTARAVSPSSPPSSYDVYQNRRSAFELTRMHSNDSLNSDRHYAKSQDSSSNIPPQGYASSPPRNDYPPHQATVAMSSPIMARRELSNPPQHMAPQAYHAAPPAQPQVLVDPNTGQQYFFPTAPQPQYYYPLVPATPVYYQAPQGYIVASQAQPMPSQPQPPQSPTHPRAVFFHAPPPTSFNSSYGSGYFVEHPPSSNVSVCGPPEPEYFQRGHTSRHSIESGSSGSTKQHLRRRNSRDSMSSSPAPSTVAPSYHPAPTSNTTSFAQMSTAEPSSPSHMGPMGGKFSTTSSCTSGFASAAGESDHNMFNTSLINTRQRPVWWGTTETTTRIGIEEKLPSPTRSQPRLLAEKRSTESEKSKSPEEERTPTLPLRREPSSQELGRSSPQDTVSEPTPPPPAKPVQKAIRMDIDFNAPVAPPAPKEEKAAKIASQNTAFTVSFDDVKDKKSVSLQDAARQAPTSRRMMRRSAPSSAKKDEASEHQDPKHYLFNKMIQGLKDAPTGHLEVSHDLRDDIDTLSEAGTYVVDTSSRKRDDGRHLTESEDSEDDTSSTVSDTPYSSAPSSARQPLTRVLPEPKSQIPPPRPSLFAAHLQQLRDRTSAPATLPKPATPTRPVRACQKQPAPSTSSNFRRGDGGRFSMRAGPSATTPSAPFNPPSTRNSAGSRSTFRPGATPPALPKKPTQTAIKDTPEMVAWLRRKEYDPRKSAAEARKIQQLKTREKIFQSNRSMSFHPGASATPFKSLQRDQRSNKSHDDLSHVGEEDEIAGGPSSGVLEKQVENLTQKCLKSIQLIKLCNQNTLSESVENLLEQVVQPMDEEDDDDMQPPESISDQLQRLSSAFDAIQKYFEEQRSGSVSPSSFRRMVVPSSSSPRPRTTVGTSRSPPASRRHPF